MLEFNNCCFCIPLRTGCLILGYLHLVGSIVLTVITSLDLATIITAIVNHANFDKAQASIAITTAAMMQLLAIVLLVFAILLIVGIHKEKKNYVKAYLIYYLIFIILYAIIYIVQIATLAIVLAHTLGNLIEILLSVYFLLVIRSYWVNMRDNSGNNFNTAYSAARSES